MFRRSAAVPFAVGAYITAAYWFTASTSFANPVDLLQAYVLLGAGTPKSSAPEVQFGRFSMELGSGRLIAGEAYRDVTDVHRSESSLATKRQRDGHRIRCIPCRDAP
jgi:hypothetical protein